MLTHRVPCPPDRGDRIRAYHLLRAMAGRFDVTLASIADEPVTPATRSELEGLTSQLLIANARPMHRRAMAAHAMLTGRAITPAAMLDRGLARRLVALHQRRPFDTVLTYCTGMIGYTQALVVRCHGRARRVGRATGDERIPARTADRHAGSTVAPDAPFRHVLDLVDVDSLKWSGFAQATRGLMRLVYAAEARRLRAVEAGRVVPFDAVTVISDNEAQRYREHVTIDHQPVVVCNGVDLERYRPSDDANRVGRVLIFTGVLSYKPNIDAVVWFARRVMPRIRAAIPEARFDIVGKSPAPAVMALDELPGVRVVGEVADTADYLRQSAVAVAPMKISPGVQNKVLEAMACGLPAVCSTGAAAGIDATPGRHLLIADSESDTAAQCVRLLLYPGYRAEIGADARQRVAQRYHWPHAMAPMLDLLIPTHALSDALSEHEA